MAYVHGGICGVNQWRGSWVTGKEVPSGIQGETPVVSLLTKSATNHEVPEELQNFY